MLRGLNPYSARVESHAAFGRFDDAAREAFDAVSPDPAERLLASATVQRGTFGRGDVLLTTHGIRFKQANGRRRADFWPILTPTRFERSGTMTFLVVGDRSLAATTPDGHELRQFAELCRLVAEAVQWDVDHAEPGSSSPDPPAG